MSPPLGSAVGAWAWGVVAGCPILASQCQQQRPTLTVVTIHLLSVRSFPPVPFFVVLSIFFPLFPPDSPGAVLNRGPRFQFRGRLLPFPFPFSPCLSPPCCSHGPCAPPPPPSPLLARCWRPRSRPVPPGPAPRSRPRPRPRPAPSGSWGAAGAGPRCSARTGARPAASPAAVAASTRRVRGERGRGHREGTPGREDTRPGCTWRGGGGVPGLSPGGDIISLSLSLFSSRGQGTKPSRSSWRMRSRRRRRSRSTRRCPRCPGAGSWRCTARRPSCFARWLARGERRGLPPALKPANSAS